MWKQHPGSDRQVPRHRDGLAGEAHSPELSLLALQRSAGNRAVNRLLEGPGARSLPPPPRSVLARQPRTTRPTASTASTATFPWRGEISATWNAALRRAPHKAQDDPYRNIIADLPHGTALVVTAEEHGWLHVEVQLDGNKLAGYVSHELVRYVGPVAPPDPFTLPTIDMSWGDAMVVVKRAHNRRLAFPDWTPTGDDARKLDLAIARLEHLARYTVDPMTYAVSFRAPDSGKIKIRRIEDFILFVEAVEQQYPQATAGEIAGELRQIWFGGSNWEALLNSRGVFAGGKAVDIEHEPDPIAVRFDITDLKTTGQALETRFGDVDIWHVIAGIDAALNGAALEPSGDEDAHLKWRTLHDADAGDPRDFATWSGDLGQAYAEYLVARYVKGDASVRLLAFVAAKASPEQLLGDIHGYIAKEVFRQIPINRDTGWGSIGHDQTVSNILTLLYLLDKSGTPAAASSETYLQTVSGKSGADLRTFIAERSLAFARPWYAKKAEEYRGKAGSFWHRPGLSKESILQGLMDEFDEMHAKNERTAIAQDKLEAAIAKFLPLLAGDVR